jgi:hypothetical protein
MSPLLFFLEFIRLFSPSNPGVDGLTHRMAWQCKRGTFASPYRACSTRWRKSANPALPYPILLISFNLFTFPSIRPLLIGRVRPALTAALRENAVTSRPGVKRAREEWTSE